jgi:alkylation response protein AidB-like acyl-CoA dehydrogenase
MKETNNDADSILRAITALVPQIVESREEIERERRLPLPIVDALKKAGAFRMTMPHDWGGAEIDPSASYASLKRSRPPTPR